MPELKAPTLGEIFADEAEVRLMGGRIKSRYKAFIRLATCL